MGSLGDILVVGLGTSGEAAAAYCAGLLGLEVDSVTVVDGSDSARVTERAERLRPLGVRVLLGVDAVPGHFDTGIASPGIRLDSGLMTSARAACDRLIAEVEFAYERSSVPWVAITGTNGKTTTTALVAHLLEAGGVPAIPVGNIGTPASCAIVDGGGPEVLVAEVSSFQLALTSTFHPRVAVLLNITPDHIDWHGSLEGYTAEKAKVFASLGADDVAVIDVDDAGSRPFASEVENRGVTVIRVSRESLHGGGAGVLDGVLVLSGRTGVVELVREDELLIRGPHNVSNALAAAAAAHAMGVGVTELREGLRSFTPIEHRLEPAGETGSIEWFNDSKATNPDAVFKAIGAFRDRPIVLLLGGRNKGNDFRPLALEATAAARAVVAFGEAGGEIEAAFSGLDVVVVRAAGLEDAVRAACDLARQGDAVVLSPACASFDEFENYEARGRAFKALVAGLQAGECE